MNLAQSVRTPLARGHGPAVDYFSLPALEQAAGVAPARPGARR